MTMQSSQDREGAKQSGSAEAEAETEGGGESEEQQQENQDGESGSTPFPQLKQIRVFQEQSQLEELRLVFGV